MTFPTVSMTFEFICFIEDPVWMKMITQGLMIQLIRIEILDCLNWGLPKAELDARIGPYVMSLPLYPSE